MAREEEGQATEKERARNILGMIDTSPANEHNRHKEVQFSSAQLKIVSMRAEKSICAPSLPLPLKEFQCLSD